VKTEVAVFTGGGHSHATRKQKFAVILKALRKIGRKKEGRSDQKVPSVRTLNGEEW